MELVNRIEKIIQSYGAELYDIESVNENGYKIYRVYITKDGGVDLNLCTDISNSISPVLDLNPPINGEYFLEVSSPGIERRLSKPKHFKSSIGERVKLKVRGEGRIKGTVESSNDEGISIKTVNGLKHYKYSEIDRAKTYFDWAIDTPSHK